MAVALFLLAGFPFGLAAEEVAYEENAKQEIGFRGQKYTPAPGVTQTTEIYKTTAGKDLEVNLHFPRGWKAEDKRPVMVFFFGGDWLAVNGECIYGPPKHYVLNDWCSSCSFLT